MEMTIPSTSGILIFFFFLQTLLQKVLSRETLKPNNAEQFMPHFYFFPHDGKFGESLTQHDRSSDFYAKYPTVQAESPRWNQAWKGDTPKIFRLFQKHWHLPFSDLQKTVDCHHFSNFNSVVKMTWQLFLVPPEIQRGGRRQDLRGLLQTVDLKPDCWESYQQPETAYSKKQCQIS